MNQAIHQVDLMRWLAGPVSEVFGAWQLGALHKIESEDVVNAVIRYASGATGVIQAATAFWPGYPERIEFHGTKGTAIITGDKLTAWDVENDSGDPPRSPRTLPPAQATRWRFRSNPSSASFSTSAKPSAPVESPSARARMDTARSKSSMRYIAPAVPAKK